MSETNGTKPEPRILSTEEILAATQLEERLVEIPELGGVVRIREFDKGRQQWIRQQSKHPRTGKLDEGKLEILLVAYGVVDPVFSVAQVDALRKVKAGILDRILKEISDLSGMTDEAVEEDVNMFPPE